MLHSPTRGYRITFLLNNYMFKDDSFLKNKKGLIFFEH